VAEAHSLAARWLYSTELPLASRRDFLFHRVPEPATHLYAVIEGDQVQARATGPLTKLTRIPHDARSAQIVGIELRPGAARDILGVSVAEMAGETRPLAELWGDSARELERELATTPSDARMTRLESILSERLRSAAARPLTQELAVWENELHTTSVAELSNRMGVSGRQLQRRWSAQVGMTPKLHTRLVRHRRVLDAIARQPTPDWRALADEIGYADQPHLIREFGALMGIAPQHLLRDIDFVEQVLGIGWLVIARSDRF
jgi:AraC-like DNA-binding protein